MIAPSTRGFSSNHSAASALATVMKSAPRKTPVTPGKPKRRLAKGERAAASASGKLAVPGAITARPGRNLSVAGLGVVSVSMNMALSGLDL